MKAWKLSFYALLALLVIGLGGCGPGKYTPKPNEELYGTWTNEQSPAFQQVVFAPNSWKWYQRIGNPAPSIDCKLELTSKWTDSEGNIWYKSIGTIIGGTAGDVGTELVVLSKLSKSATVLEFVHTFPSNEQELKTPVYPVAIDPKRYASYFLFNRARE